VKAAGRIEPRLLSAEVAAIYCGVSVPTFKRVCPVSPKSIRTRVLYDRVEIDRWLDRLPHREDVSQGGIVESDPLERSPWAAP
jgi:hypothetical protein